MKTGLSMRVCVYECAKAKSLSHSSPHSYCVCHFDSTCRSRGYANVICIYSPPAAPPTPPISVSRYVSKKANIPTSSFINPPCDSLQVLRPDNSANWTLQIKYPQPRDSGVYECQINTEPKMSLSYTFNVVGE